MFSDITDDIIKEENINRNWRKPIGYHKDNRYFRNNEIPALLCMICFYQMLARITRGGVEDTRLEAKAKAKDTKKIRGQGQGQGQPFRGQTLSRPRTGMLEAKAKDQGHKAQVLSKKKKKKGLHKNFPAISKKKKKKKVFTKIFQAVFTKKRFPKNFSSAPQNFIIPKNRAVLEPRTGQFSRTWGLEAKAKAKDLTIEAKAKAKDFKMCPRGRPRGQGRPRGLHLCE